MYDLVKQNGINQDAPGTGGKYQLKNDVYGSSNGDAVDNTQSGNPVDQAVSALRQRNLQGTGSTFVYPAGKSAAMVF